MVSVSDRTLVLGVTGSIAAYKAVELVRTFTAAGAGFACDTNLVVILDPAGGSKNFPLLPKRQLARRIFDRVVGLRTQRG